MFMKNLVHQTLFAYSSGTDYRLDMFQYEKGTNGPPLSEHTELNQPCQKQIQKRYKIELKQEIWVKHKEKSMYLINLFGYAT